MPIATVHLGQRKMFYCHVQLKPSTQTLANVCSSAITVGNGLGIRKCLLLYITKSNFVSHFALRRAKLSEFWRKFTFHRLLVS